ncbi:MAG: type I DNA topoisomerase [Candidatus Harrisonbacteria bacterium CG10_big_fil_rev_8_21_14_0_10_40_38]|uniref:DNA topoisomerase 1 n=1 Tax=Candidatus Harrisonbacteria bacterium CG10_big_fil_rev_8_21_14_0_10_40_38 TaxID=1974583 RepID=A0A2H0URY9_9BACT|nr:MAG: type I DNA topoisomerase [Candidatus Harrisonbacteria bacterium CG10_big_fil_rev_8_21_14_0_10_40_38]
MNLVIVESPTKAKTIGKFLGKDYTVVSCYGHVRDLPKSKLGIDVEHEFEPQYVIPTRTRKTVTALKKEAAKSDTIILATDEDREGEAIAWHLMQALKLSGSDKKIERIVFHEITKSAIESALKSPRKLNDHMVDAQQARRVLDRLVGYKLSPFLWKKVAGGLSAGRVQSVAVRLIVDRETEIKNFKPKEYWTISANIGKQNDKEKDFEAQLFKIGNENLEKFSIENKESADKIVKKLETADYSVNEVEKKESSKNPLPPFITSTLQQEAAKRLRFSSKKTMVIAQQLYENGLITYMRTDSVNLSKESVESAKVWLTENLGEKYAIDTPRAFKAKSKLAQEAHEAIRPTNPGLSPENASVDNADGKKLYELIWQRFTASQMPQAKISSTTVTIEAMPKDKSEKKHFFKATGQAITFDGYLKVWPQKLEEREAPAVEKDEKLDLRSITPNQHMTEPPPRYSEATLIKTLEENGIGRPSTYAPTISTIQTRQYVIKEAGRFKPTEIGELVNKVLTEHFPDIVDIGFTARMEDELDDIAEGESGWQTIIGSFYKPFEKQLEEKYAEVSKDDFVKETTDEVCEKCGKPMAVKLGRFGKFLACTGFPDCKNTKRLEGSGTNKTAPRKTGVKCPTCSEGEIVERRVSRGRARGKIFWGCSRYPECKYASWERPEGVPEPEKNEEKEEPKEEE